MPVIKRHQTLADFATQYTGSIQGLVQVAQLNGLSMTDDIAPGTDLVTGEVIDVRNSTQTTGDEIATIGRVLEPEQLEGIGYWIISLDFKVS
ncbi:hypothetical protein F0L74_05880 [Chitinophaga agrisoli]|uniref:LysM domain-containing protein n=1 Tax=Chitinophaga agrisoli TaxID=2607653 RepID=A0A5B2W292_9BACT|nr:hypothetical protein [Chitinophaga agrisoli]KAA2245485.1 hypothetical protein F0L74_05880 [Chitinophaga agrisoli]